MKATIYKADGTRIEAEGTPEEIARLAQTAQAYVPYWYYPYPWLQPYPSSPFYGYKITSGSATGAVSTQVTYGDIGTH